VVHEDLGRLLHQASTQLDGCVAELGARSPVRSTSSAGDRRCRGPLDPLQLYRRQFAALQSYRVAKRPPLHLGLSNHR
jgi:hypothetical protein